MNVKKMFAIMVVILVVLTVLVFFRKSQESQRPSIIEQAKFERLIPEDLKKDNVVRLELYAGADPEKKVIIAKDGDKWRVKSHFNSPAKKENVEEYIDKIVKLKGEFRAELPTDDALADYNLKDDQAFHVDVYTSETGEPALRLLVGKSPNFRLTFVRKAGERKVYDGGVNFRQEAGVYGDETDKTPTPDRWLDKEVIRVDKEKITRLAMETPERKLVFERKEKEQPQGETSGSAEGEGEKKEGEGEKTEGEKKKEYEWILASGGVGGKFKELGLNTLLGRFSPLTASNIVDPSKKSEYGLEPPMFKLTLSRENEGDVVLEAGRPNPTQNGYIRVATGSEDIVYELSKYTFDQIFSKTQDLFDLPSLNLDKDKIQLVEITQPEGRVVLAKESSGDWKVKEPVIDLYTQVSTINTLTSALASWKAVDYVDPDVDVGEFNKVVTFKTSEESHTFKFANESKGTDGYYVMLDDNPTKLIMNRIDANKILLKPKDVYDLKILSFGSDKVTSLELKEDGTSQTIKKGEGDQWLLTDGKTETKLVTDNVKSLFAKLDGLQASDIRPDLKWNSFTHRLNLRINITDSEPLEIIFGEDKNGRIVSTVPKHNAVVELNKDRWDEIQSALAKAKEPQPEPKPEETSQPSTGPSEGEQPSTPSEGENVSGTTEQGTGSTPEATPNEEKSSEEPRSDTGTGESSESAQGNSAESPGATVTITESAPASDSASQ